MNAHRYVRYIAALLVVGVLLASCTTASGIKRTPLEVAEISYVQGSVFYEAAMTALQDLRGERLVTDKQWAIVERAQQTVRTYAPQYHQLVSVWRATGTKPSGFDTAATKVAAASADVASVLAEVQR